MIKSILFPILLLIFIFRANAQNESSYIDSVRNHRYVIFSWTGTPTREISRYRDQINNHFSRIDYEVLDSLYRSETGVLQFYAFIVICKKFPEMINSEHKKMLKTKDQIMVLTASQTKPSMLPKKDIAATLYKDAMGVIDAQKKTEKTVQSFICDYAKFPKSYKSISFNKFHLLTTIDPNTGKIDEKTKVYVIRHYYEIKDSLGLLVECFNTFKLNYEFKINIIEAEESNTHSSYPPKINEWLKLYGRVLTEEEKIKLSYNIIDSHKK